MNIKKIQALSDEELGDRVAELCEWEWVDGMRYWLPPASRIPEGYEGVFFLYDRPNYPADLNAMHEAVATITDGKEKGKYQANLQAIVVPEGIHPLCIEAEMLRTEATARQRAEAFVLTKDKS